MHDNKYANSALLDLENSLKSNNYYLLKIYLNHLFYYIH